MGRHGSDMNVTISVTNNSQSKDTDNYWKGNLVTIP